MRWKAVSLVYSLFFVFAFVISFPADSLAKSGKGAVHSKSAQVKTVPAKNHISDDCVTKYKLKIKNCGKNKKCIRKYEKLKSKCFVVHKPIERPAVPPYHPPVHTPEQPIVRTPPIQHLPQRQAPQEAEGVLQRTVPQPTGKATGIRSVPDNEYRLPWLK